MKTKQIKDLTLLDYAYFSSDGYLDECKPTNVPKGWTVVAIAPPSVSGYQGAAFRNEQGEIIISHRGTEFDKQFFKDGVLTDLAIGLGTYPLQASDARQFTTFIQKEYNPKTITHTGHSLGGWLADFEARISGAQAIVFDSPGIHFRQQNIINFINWTNKYIKGKKLGNAKTLYILSSPNLVNIWGTHDGTVIRLSDYMKFHPVKSHYLEESIIPALKKYYASNEGTSNIDKALNKALNNFNKLGVSKSLDSHVGAGSAAPLPSKLPINSKLIPNAKSTASTSKKPFDASTIPPLTSSNLPNKSGRMYETITAGK